MTPTTILLIAAAMAFVTFLMLGYYALKYRDEESAPFLAILAFVAGMVCFACVAEAVKESKMRHPTPATEKP